jgi:DNA-binding transcriptional LysR family regulator
MSDELDKKIRSFLCISIHGSLSKASEQLDISQPSLSRQLANLESELGSPLFKRTGRGLVLTDAGTHLASIAGPAFLAIDSALRQIRDEFGVTQGALKLATVHTLTYYFLGDVVSRFVNHNRDVNVSFMARSSSNVVRLVESGRADLGFVYDSEVASTELVTTPLFTESMSLVVKSSDDAMLGLVSSGVGACVLPSLIPSRLLEQYGLRRVEVVTPVLSRKVVAIHKADPAPTAILKVMLRFAVESSQALK